MARGLCAAVCALALLSCSSARGAAGREAGPDFLGDYEPVRLEDAAAWSVMLGRARPVELELHLVPRTNRVEVYFRDAQNRVCVVLSPENRAEIAAAAALFAEGLEAGGLPDRRAKAGNSWSQSPCTVGWGVAGIARVTNKARLRLNHEHLDDREGRRPYFLLEALPGPDREEGDVYSPSVGLYFSPAQLEAFCGIVGRDALRALVDGLDARAYAY